MATKRFCFCLLGPKKIQSYTPANDKTRQAQLCIKYQNRREIFRATYSLVEQYLWKWSKIFIVGPHLSGLLFSGHIVTVGKATFSIGYDIVSIIVIVGFSLHAEM